LSPLGEPDSSWNLDGEWFAKTFRDQLGIYGAYWRDDPQFDMTNTLRAAPHLPCPELDHEMMSRLARFAIDANFGRVRRATHKPAFDVHSHMRRVMRSHCEMPKGSPPIAHLGIEVDGPGGGQWELVVRDGRLVAIDDGVSARSSAVFQVNSTTFYSLVQGELSVSQAVKTGRVRIEGNGMDRRRLEAVLQATATAATAEVAGR
jgi:putative sterol carrier protein